MLRLVRVFLLNYSYFLRDSVNKIKGECLFYIIISTINLIELNLVVRMEIYVVIGI